MASNGVLPHPTRYPTVAPPITERAATLRAADPRRHALGRVPFPRAAPDTRSGSETYPGPISNQDSYSPRHGRRIDHRDRARDDGIGRSTPTRSTHGELGHRRDRRSAASRSRWWGGGHRNASTSPPPVAYRDRHPDVPDRWPVVPDVPVLRPPHAHDMPITGQRQGRSVRAPCHWSGVGNRSRGSPGWSGPRPRRAVCDVVV